MKKSSKDKSDQPAIRDTPTPPVIEFFFGDSASSPKSRLAGVTSSPALSGENSRIPPELTSLSRLALSSPPDSALLPHAPPSASESGSRLLTRGARAGLNSPASKLGFMAEEYKDRGGFWELKEACSNKDYCTSILCVRVKRRTI